MLLTRKEIAKAKRSLKQAYKLVEELHRMFWDKNDVETAQRLDDLMERLVEMMNRLSIPADRSF
jgi:predicted translin family RNA/ssDNA-binding protein